MWEVVLNYLKPLKNKSFRTNGSCMRPILQDSYQLHYFLQECAFIKTILART